MAVLHNLVWLVLVCLSCVSGKLQVDCGHPHKKAATLKFHGDVHSVTAITQGDKTCKFQTYPLTGDFKLSLGYTSFEQQACLFRKSSSLSNYQVYIDVKFHKILETAQDKKYLVECAFGFFRDNITDFVPLTAVYKPAHVLVYNKGIQSDATFKLYPIDLYSRVITAPIAMGRIIKINTLMTPKVKSLNGYTPIVCTASSIDGAIEITILSDGCGTGFPWKLTEGFAMSGGTGFSPSFRMFRIKKNEGVLFKCLFNICLGNCNGNSCKPSARNKRSAGQNTYNDTITTTSYIHVDSDIQITTPVAVSGINIME